MKLASFLWIIARRTGITSGLSAMVLAAVVPTMAQLAPAEPDPLARIRDAAKSNVQACSATGEMLCEQVAPKLIANAQGDSPLEENFRRLTDATNDLRQGNSPDERAVAWAIAAFHSAGVNAHVESYSNPKSSGRERQNVVAEFRGREKPDEWVLVGAHLSTWGEGHGTSGYNCEAAMVVDAARDISLTGVHARRSIRFVLFTGQEQDMPGSWAYARSHRADLDQARAAIILGSGCMRMTGYSLEGRRDIEPGLREAMKPIDPLGADNYVYAAAMGNDDFDFVLEGVPTLGALSAPVALAHNSPVPNPAPGKFEISDLKRNTAIIAVTAFGIAERSAPIGSRQSRAEVEYLLKTTSLEQLMKGANIWPLWESGERGRMP